MIAPTAVCPQPDSALRPLNLPAHILQVLADEGIRDLGDWRRLGRKRFRIFGITTATAKKLDAAATEARP